MLSRQNPQQLLLLTISSLYSVSLLAKADLQEQLLIDSMTAAAYTNKMGDSHSENCNKTGKVDVAAVY